MITIKHFMWFREQLEMPSKMRLSHVLRFLWPLLFFLHMLSVPSGNAVRRDGPLLIDEKPVIDIFFLTSGEGWLLSRQSGKQFLFKAEKDGTEWLKLPLDYHIETISFFDTLHGWAIAESATDFQLIRTIDGGTTWLPVRALPQLSALDTTVVRILLTSAEEGLILAAHPKGVSLALKIEMKGEAITEIAALSGKFGVARAVFSAPDGKNLWAIGNDSILHSVDSGKSWSAQVTHSTLPSHRKAVTFTSGWSYSNGTVFVVGQSGGGVIFKSDNFGETWKLVSESDRANSFIDIAFWDDQHGCAVGLSNLLFCTSDSGNSWSEKSELPKAEHNMAFMGNVFQRIVFSKKGRRWWVLASGGALFETRDEGRSWRKLDLFERSE